MGVDALTSALRRTLPAAWAGANQHSAQFASLDAVQKSYKQITSIKRIQKHKTAK